MVSLAGFNFWISQYNAAAMFVDIMQQFERDRSMFPQQSVNYTGIRTMNSNSRWMTYSNADISFTFGSG